MMEPPVKPGRFKMKRARFSEEQIIGILKVAETAGNIRAVCQEHNIIYINMTELMEDAIPRQWYLG